MFQLKIIEDPIVQRKWIVRQDDITKISYKSILRYEDVRRFINSLNNNEPQNQFFRDILSEEISRFFVNRYNDPLKRIERDIIRPLTIQEYSELNFVLKALNFKYNKKKNLFICLKS